MFQRDLLEHPDFWDDRPLYIDVNVLKLFCLIRHKDPVVMEVLQKLIFYSLYMK